MSAWLSYPSFLEEEQGELKCGFFSPSWPFPAYEREGANSVGEIVTSSLWDTPNIEKWSFLGSTDP
jgi:hypothetical protein